MILQLLLPGLVGGLNKAHVRVEEEVEKGGLRGMLGKAHRENLKMI